jgi:Lrp/AsnC family leucine-responsive transcriptional regulator
MNVRVKFDSVDRRILNILQKNNRLTNLELSEKAGLSPPTCLKRVRRLRQQKVILADVALLDPSLVKNLCAFVEVELEQQGEQFQQAFEKKMDRTPEVTQCYMISGDSDFIVVIEVIDMDGYHRLVRRTFTVDTNVRTFRTVFVMNRTKFRTDINLESE